VPISWYWPCNVTRHNFAGFISSSVRRRVADYNSGT
jgi:hypothetical protein